MADTLTGSFSQFINKCKDRIVDWCKDASKTVCLPLTGGSMSSGANITTTGTVTSGKVVVDTNTSIDDGVLSLKGENRKAFIYEINNTIESGANATYPSTDYDAGGLWIRDKNNNNLGLFNYRLNSTSSQVWMCVHNYLNANSHALIGIIHNKDKGFYTECVSPNSNVTTTNQIATTGWVNSLFTSVKTDATKWVKTEVTAGNATTNNPKGVVNQTCVRLKEGIQICWGLVSNAKPNYLVTFSKPFISATYSVTATLHYGGSGSGSGLIDSRAHEDSSVHVYDTTTSSFRLGRDMYVTDYNNYINNGTEIGLGWVEWIAIGWWTN